MEIEERIIRCLKNSEESMTIVDISKEIGLNRITVSKYLAVMEAKGILKYRPVGKAKLFYIAEAGK